MFGPAETACRSTLDHDFRYPTAAATLHFTFELVMQGGENYRRRNECNELSLFKGSSSLRVKSLAHRGIEPMTFALLARRSNQLS